MPLQTAWKTMKSSTVVATNQETPYHLSETEFPFLDAKPKVDEYKLSKNRRNANGQLLQKKLADQAFVLKQVVSHDQRGKAIGKKRRARLLSEICEDMKPNVFYSMNRKNRWEIDSSADYLKDRRSDENVQLSALNQHFTIKGITPNKDVLVFHKVDEDGVLSSRKSQSRRGSALTELNRAEGEKPLSIRYVVAKASPNIKGPTTSSSNKVKHLPRSTKRAQLDMSVYTTDNEMNDDELGLTSPGSLAQYEETTKMYTPRQEKYTLADFLEKKQGPATTRSSRSRRVPLDTFVKIEMPELQEDPDYQSISIDSTNKFGRNNTLFKTVYAQCTGHSLNSRDEWLRQCQILEERFELRFRWLNTAHCSFQLDVTPLLTVSKKPHLVLTMAYEMTLSRVRLLLNGSQKCEANILAIEKALADKFSGLDSIVQAVIENVQISENSSKQLSTEFTNELNSTKLSMAVTPLDDYSLLYNPISYSEVVKKPVTEEETDFDDDFEVIKMEELNTDIELTFDMNWRDIALDSQVAEMKTLCDECGENKISKIVVIDSCGHSFCIRCLRASLYQQISENSAVLRCFFKDCSAEVPMPLLQSLFELPVVSLALHSCAEARAKQLNQHLFSCPSGCGVVIVEPNNKKIGHIQCSSCKYHFCLKCADSPHWPLNCNESYMWTNNCKMENPATINEPSSKSCKSKLKKQFWNAAHEARNRRLDVHAHCKIVKDKLKQAGYKLKREYAEVFKACLQVIENGCAWLYMNRHNHEQNWYPIKTAILLLNSELTVFESSMLNCSQAREKITDNVEEMSKILKKTVSNIQLHTVNI